MRKRLSKLLKSNHVVVLLLCPSTLQSVETADDMVRRHFVRSTGSLQHRTVQYQEVPE